jgi:protease II
MDRKSNNTPSNTNTPASVPVAERRPHRFTVHGITITDDYAWLKDDNWQDVLRDPSILEPDIRSYLETENNYTESVLGHTATLQNQLVAEMRGRIKEDDSSVPAPDGPFAYFHKYREGGQHEMIGRAPRNGGESHILLDGDALAADSNISNSVVPAIHSTTGWKPGALIHAVRNIFPSACATGERAKIALTSSRKPTVTSCGTPIQVRSFT